MTDPTPDSTPIDGDCDPRFSAVREAFAHLESLGMEKVEVSLPHTEYAVACYYILACAEASANLSRYDGVKYGYRSKHADNLMDMYTNTREEGFGEELMRQLERTVVLSIIDNKWREHLAEMDYLRSGIGLRAMGQRDPLVEYQREGFSFFEELVDSVKHDATRYMFHVDVAREQQERKPAQVATSSAKTVAQLKGRQVTRDGVKIGRNQPCPCGSGEKYKRCHGAAGAEPLAAS